MMSTQPITPPNGGPLACPRCGYDLAGAVATWTDECPLRGTCVECGLELDFNDLHYVHRHDWLLDVDWRHRTVHRLLRSLGRSFRPWRFWREIQLTDPVHLRPIVWLTVAVLLGIMVATYGWALAMDVRWAAATTVFGHLIRALERFRFVALAMLPGVLVMMFVMPCSYGLLRHTMATARVQRRHILRVWCYSWLAPGAVLSIYLLLRGALIHFGAGWISAMVDLSALATMLPLGDTGRFLVRHWPGVPPAVLLAVWLLVWWWSAARSYLRLPRAGLIAAAMTTVALLSGAIAMLWGPGTWW